MTTRGHSSDPPGADRAAQDRRRRLLEQALAEIKSLRAQVKTLRRAVEPVAIIGLSCRFPGGIQGPADF